MPGLPRFVVPSRKAVGEISAEAMKSPVAQALAEKIAEEARRIAIEEGHPELADAVKVTGVRPKGRGQIQVVIDHENAAAVEYGDNNTEKARILGRAAGVKLFPDVEG